MALPGSLSYKLTAGLNFILFKSIIVAQPLMQLVRSILINVQVLCSSNNIMLLQDSFHIIWQMCHVIK